MTSTEEQKTEATTKASPIKVGDLVYAVGPGHHAPHGPTDLCVYSTVVKNVRLEGSYSASAPADLLASAAIAIELGDDRPVLGFPKWTYSGYEVGINIHRSAAEALSAFTKRAQARREKAERECEHAVAETTWALNQTCALTNERDLVMPEGLSDAGRRAYEIIVAYFKEHGLTTRGAKTFWSPREWKEEYGTDSHLIIAYSGSMRVAFSMDAAYELDCDHYQRTGMSREPYALYEGMQAKLREAGLFFEECTLWYSAVYSTEAK